MLIRFHRGKASAGAAAAYLLGSHDHAGVERPGVEVLRGDPDQVARITDSLPFEGKYRSGVLAWAPEDRPTDAQIDRAVDEFERTAWAGLEKDRYAWTAILHREQGGGAHVHVLTARADLETGKSLNIAPPGWRKTYNPLAQALNHEHGWARPEDPDRRRITTPQFYGKGAEGRDAINAAMRQHFADGLLQSRQDVVTALEGMGLDVVRQGKDYMTARHPESGYRWRLRGGLYEETFTPDRIRGPDSPASPGHPDGRRRGSGEDAADHRGRNAGDRRAASRAWRTVAGIRERRAAAHAARYPDRSPDRRSGGPGAVVDPGGEGDRDIHRGDGPADGLRGMAGLPTPLDGGGAGPGERATRRDASSDPRP